MPSKLFLFQSGVIFLIIVQCVTVVVIFQKMKSVDTSRKVTHFSSETQLKKISDTFDMFNKWQNSPSENDEPYFDYEENSPLAHILTIIPIHPLEKLFLSYTPLFEDPNVFVPKPPWLVTSPPTLEQTDYIILAASKPPEQIKILEYVENMPRTASSFKEEFPLEFYLANDDEEQTRALQETEQMLDDVLTMMKGDALPCRKTVAMGGRYCKKIPDGQKYLCLDSVVGSLPRDCLVYSFGIGNDFSFERMMGLFGCHVYAFDDDEHHSMYPIKPFNRVYLAAVRLGNETVQVQVAMTKLTNGAYKYYQYIYRPIDNIIHIMNHSDEILHYLKIDIEGSEWNVFDDSFFKLDVLNRTVYISVETHFLGLNNTALITSPAQLYSIVSQYYRELRSRGFHLFHYEPNYIGPRFTSVLGRLVPVFAEMVWINTRAPQAKQRHKPSKYMEKIMNKLEFV